MVPFFKFIQEPRQLIKINMIPEHEAEEVLKITNQRMDETI